MARHVEHPLPKGAVALEGHVPVQRRADVRLQEALSSVLVAPPSHGIRVHAIPLTLERKQVQLRGRNVTAFSLEVQTIKTNCGKMTHDREQMSKPTSLGKHEAAPVRHFLAGKIALWQLLGCASASCCRGLSF